MQASANDTEINYWNYSKDSIFELMLKVQLIVYTICKCFTPDFNVDALSE